MLNFNLEPETERKLQRVLSSYKNTDTFFKNAIQYQISELKKEIININSDLKEFEVKNKMTSADFYAAFKDGKRGEEQDEIIWAGIYELQLKSKERLDALL